MYLFKHKNWNLEIEASGLGEAALLLGCEEIDLSIIKTWTDEEYILKDIPQCFHGILSCMAYERGHSAGEEECLRILRGLVYDLAPAINKFKQDILENKA